MKDVLYKLKKHKKVYRMMLMFISLLITAIMYNLFLLPINIVTGSTSGIATITHYVYGINPALMIFFLSVACAIYSLLYMGFNKTLASIVCAVVYPLLIELTSNLRGLITVTSTDDIILISIFAGVLFGLANGLMYKTGYSNGGFPVISQVLYEKHKISVSTSSLIINLSIVLVGGIYFGSANVMYALIFLFVNNIILNRILLGVNNNKALYIMTTKENDIKEYLMKELNHRITVFDVKGGLLEKERKVILSIVPSREYYKVKEEILKIDKNAFFTVTNSYQVKGAK